MSVKSLKKWLAGLLRPRTPRVVPFCKGTRTGYLLEWPDGRRHEIPPLWWVESLPQPFQSLFDFDALEREAERYRKERKEPRTSSRTSPALREFLKSDVSRTEELQLTAVLSKRETWLVENPDSAGSSRDTDGRGAVAVSLSGRRLEICFPCDDPFAWFYTPFADYDCINFEEMEEYL